MSFKMAFKGLLIAIMAVYITPLVAFGATQIQPPVEKFTYNNTYYYGISGGSSLCDPDNTDIVFLNSYSGFYPNGTPTVGNYNPYNLGQCHSLLQIPIGQAVFNLSYVQGLPVNFIPNISGDYYYTFVHGSDTRYLQFYFDKVSNAVVTESVINTTSGSTIYNFTPKNEVINPTTDFNIISATATTTTFYFVGTDTQVFDQICIELQNLETGTTPLPVCEDINIGFSSSQIVWNNLSFGRFSAILYFFNSVTLDKMKAESYEFINGYTRLAITQDDLDNFFGLSYGLSTATTTSSGLVLEDCSTVTGNFGLNSAVCSVLNGLKSILNWAFYPSLGTVVRFNDFKSALTTKPPVGYFYVVKDNISLINASSTSPFNVVLPSSLKRYIFSPFDIGIGSILWFYFLVHFYRRLKSIDL